MLSGLRFHKISSRFVVILAVLFIGMGSLVGFQLKAYRDSMIAERKDKTRTLVESVHSLIDFYYDKAAKEGLGEDDAKKYAIQAIRQVNTNERDYFWIQNMKGKVIMHAALPELEGHDMTTVVQPDGRILAFEMIKMVQKNKAGFLTYAWAKPGANDGKVYPKTAYVSGFEPWGWIVGSGLYLDDVEEAFRNALYIAGAMSVALLLFCVALAMTASESLRRS
jgi:methyl-accepting chemotaxis protein